MVAYIEVPTNSAHPYRTVTLFQRLFSGNFDPENVHRKLLVILKIVPDVGYDVYTGKIDQYQRSKDVNRRMANGREENWD
jgi:hypothetical protein